MTDKAILIISEKKSSMQIIQKSLEERGLLNNNKIVFYHINHKKNVFNHFIKISSYINEKYNLSPMNEFSAKYSSKKYFPFNKIDYNSEINNKEEYLNLQKLIKEADVIVNACDPNKIGNLFFSSLILSGFFDLKNKKIKNMKIKDYGTDNIFSSFLNLKSNKKVTEKLKKRSPELWNIEFEMAYNDIKWQSLNPDDKFIFTDYLLTKYSLKYNVNLFKLIINEKAGYFTKLNNKEALHFLINNSENKDKFKILLEKWK